MHENQGPTESVTADDANAAAAARLRIVAQARLQSVEIRQNMVSMVIDALDPIVLDYHHSTTDAEVARDVALAARFVTGLANALAEYMVIGDIKPLPEYVEPEETE